MHELQLCCLFWRESGWHAYFLFIVFISGWIRSLAPAVDGELTVLFLLLWVLLTNSNPPQLFSLRTVSSPSNIMWYMVGCFVLSVMILQYAVSYWELVHLLSDNDWLYWCSKLAFDHCTKLMVSNFLKCDQNLRMGIIDRCKGLCRVRWLMKRKYAF